MNNLKSFIAILVLFLNLACLNLISCAKSRPEATNIVPYPAKKVYTKPEIGMNNFELRDLCGEKYKVVSMTETPDGKTVILSYDGDLKKECVGTFTIVNDKLFSISK